MDTAERLVEVFIIACFVFVIGFFIFFFVMCCVNFKKAYGHTLLNGSAAHTAGYTVTQTPVGTTITAYQAQTYSPPYPTEGVPVHMPMPMPMPMPTGPPPAAGFIPSVAPCPTTPTANMNPPSYDAAISGAGQTINTLKQSSFSPIHLM